MTLKRNFWCAQILWSFKENGMEALHRDHCWCHTNSVSLKVPHSLVKSVKHVPKFKWETSRVKVLGCRGPIWLVVTTPTLSSRVSSLPSAGFKFWVESMSFARAVCEFVFLDVGESRWLRSEEQPGNSLISHSLVLIECRCDNRSSQYWSKCKLFYCHQNKLLRLKDIKHKSYQPSKI